MNVLVVGGGPGGLYASILLKKAHPDWSVEVVERNPPDATYGWGIVFSDRTLSSFREADPESSQAIVDRFVLWDTIEVRHRGTSVRCGGNVFAGMSRRILLDVLQRRAHALGVVLEFRRELDDRSRIEQADLCIAADGIRSFVRGAFESTFRPEVRIGRSKYAWFGTDQVFDAFTFLFRETPHGLFQAHVYPHVGRVATMIVECTESTWCRAGLDRAGETESLALCEEVFRDDLAGRRLYANRSDWISFPTVRCRTWRHGHVALLGDAAHTAHFGIGSGTKLAMEDAIAIAAAFTRRGDDVPTALAEYELERRPVVAALQQAALESQEYFETTERSVAFDPLPFAFRLMTRNSRISYDELRRRDSTFIDRLDRAFESREHGDDAGSPRLVAPPPAFSRLRLRDVELANRIVLSPATLDRARDGVPGEPEGDRLVRCARAGAGLVMTEILAVAPDGRVTPGCSGIYRPETAAALGRVAALVHEHDGKLGARIGHAGRRGATRPRDHGIDRPLGEGAWPLLAASEIAYGPGRRSPRAMTRADMDRVRDDFVRAAREADRAGVDLLELHCAQGYLLWGFLSPLSNAREDGYGGSVERRAAYPLEVLEAVRAAWPQAKPLAVALSAGDGCTGGLGLDDVVRVAHLFAERGCDLVHVITGIVELRGTPRMDGRAPVAHADRVRNEVHVPTLVDVRTGTTDEVNTVIAAGRADLCLLPPHRLEHG